MSAAVEPGLPRRSLRASLLLGLIAYLALLTIGVLANDYFVNESAENLVWESLLNAELDHFQERRAASPGYRWPQTETLEMFEIAPADTVDPVLRALRPGIHDEVEVYGKERVLLIRDAGEMRYVLALDITDLEEREDQFRKTVFVSAFASVVLLGALVYWGVARLTRPLQDLAVQIGGLRPEQLGQRVRIPGEASSELAVIADAMNAYSEQIERFVERERDFVTVASHELRTPLTVISGAVDFAQSQPGLPPNAVKSLERVNHAIADVSELVTLLLVLAKNPERLAEASEPIALHLLLPAIVDEYAAMASARTQLSIELGAIARSDIVAPLQMVKAAIGNLLRNAIENTYQGTIVVRLDAPHTVVIENPGDQASPEQVARIYARLARGGGRHGGGIGLELIFRLCSHLGWQLSATDDTRGGIRMTLALGSTG